MCWLCLARYILTFSIIIGLPLSCILYDYNTPDKPLEYRRIINNFDTKDYSNIETKLLPKPFVLLRTKGYPKEIVYLGCSKYGITNEYGQDEYGNISLSDKEIVVYKCNKDDEIIKTEFPHMGPGYLHSIEVIK